MWQPDRQTDRQTAFNHANRHNIPHCEVAVSVHDDHRSPGDLAQWHFDVVVTEPQTLQTAAATNHHDSHAQTAGLWLSVCLLQSPCRVTQAIRNKAVCNVQQYLKWWITSKTLLQLVFNRASACYKSAINILNGWRQQAANVDHLEDTEDWQTQRPITE